MIGDYLRIIRQKLSLSQEDLARLLNVSFATVNRWEISNNKSSRLAMQSIDAFCCKYKLQLVSEWLTAGGENHEG